MKKIRNILLSFFVLLPLLTTAVFADMGPKPSVNLEIRGLDASVYYVTLLSEHDTTGPYSASARFDNSGDYTGADLDVYQAFEDYQDRDGYYFLQFFEKADIKADKNGEYGVYAWTYYPPERFKILIYLPESDEMLVCNEIIDTYAFDSYYEVTVTKDTLAVDTAAADTVTVEQTYGWGWEIFAFLVRMLMTIGVEILIAKLFAFRGKELLVILGANVVTQLALNVAFYLTGYTSVFFLYVFAYGLWEVMVFCVEALIYTHMLPTVSAETERDKRPIRYALWANLCSFVLGYFVSLWFPFVF